ncbi:sulfite exporter TauE/SafE family protein [Crenobacter caeni]|uniref:Probable membrane transporter protein n=1 Tax=Crenobacter caeni TaxID=2705474 RepID=A0A6B2KQ27_9NEIS|nr:sulfite exporter TauE/SafE family protein [Crenobacter caeni]NDV12250.1 sulfite exporter TauE/SafE family protein [Crenobacter caeni]
MTEYFYLAAVAFIGGVAGATVGGAGLVQLPALLNAFPGSPLPFILGTNKLIFALSGANNVRRYLQTTRIEWPLLLPALVVGVAASVFGASLIGKINEAWFKPVLLVVLVLIAGYILTHKQLGETESAPAVPDRAAPVAGAAGGALLGLYQGMFGPAAISFTTLALVRARGMAFARAVGNAQLFVNTCNAAAMLWFLAHGQCLYEVALLMGACSIAGSFVGLKLAEKGDSHLIRLLFIGVLVVEIARYGWSILA